MLYQVAIEITLRSSILDPQGKATQMALDQLDFKGIEDVRIGKYIELRVDATSAQDAEALARSACEKVLANPVMEDFKIQVELADVAV